MGGLERPGHIFHIFLLIFLLFCPFHTLFSGVSSLVLRTTKRGENRRSFSDKPTALDEGGK